jgi:thioredoxin reductase
MLVVHLVEVMTMNETFDVVVIGGGAAGLSGALMLTRSRRSVAVVDGGQPRNAPAAGVHGLLGREGIPPTELLRLGRAEVAGYGGQIIDGQVETVERAPDGFAVRLAGGRVLHARRVLVATGLTDLLPDVPGLAERWGRDVLHCPYCHGWEVRDRQIAILATGPASVHHALLFRQLSDRVSYLVNRTELADEHRLDLTARGIEIVDGALARLLVTADQLTGVLLTDGRRIDCQAVAVATRMQARVDFLRPLGLEPEAAPNGLLLPADPVGRTSVDGIWVAGNATDLMANVGAAAAAGAMAGAALNADLVGEELRLARAELRSHR